MWTVGSARALLITLALSAAAARADEPRKPPDPDPGFLEFLGSVDRLAEVNPDYLSAAPGIDPPPNTQAAKPPPPPPPPNPPSAPPPRGPTPNGTGATSSE